MTRTNGENLADAHEVVAAIGARFEDMTVKIDEATADETFRGTTIESATTIPFEGSRDPFFELEDVVRSLGAEISERKDK